jgi:hypothetical protein
VNSRFLFEGKHFRERLVLNNLTDRMFKVFFPSLKPRATSAPIAFHRARKLLARDFYIFFLC